MYDNQADAPDELTIRKGDIVTVIEKDIDGLTGWWLCLLHGQQGIVPGNRLKVIPPLELDQFEQKSVCTKKRASYETDDNSDGHDAVDGIPHNYDYLPNPVKTPAFVPQLSIKDMFDIPLKGQEKRNSGNLSEELYDVPSSLNTTLDTTQEIYDIPSHRSSNDLNQSTSSIPTGYDSPRSARKQIVVENQETYDIPSNLTTKRQPPKQPQPYKVPVVGLNLNTSQEIYDQPTKSKSSIAVDELMGEILDSPFNSDSDMSTIKRVPSSNHSNNSSPRSSYMPSEQQEVYDVPKKDNLRLNLHLKNSSSNMSNTLPRGFSPRNKKNLQSGTPARLQEIYDIPSNASVSVSTNNRSLPATPLSDRKINESFGHQQQIYDIPAPRKNDPTTNPEFINMLRQLERQDQQHSTSNRSSLSSTQSSSHNNNRMSQELYDVPNRSSSNRSSIDASVSSYQHPRNECSNINVQQEIYDVPHSKTKRISGGHLLEAPNQTSTPRDQEIYDVPPSSARTPDQLGTTPVFQEELYDIPPNSKNISQQEIYDVPSKSNNISQQEIYDVPSAHDVNKVMAEAYESHKANRNNNNNNNNNSLLVADADDDYVDYYDIWNKEPPKELIQQHAKVLSRFSTYSY